MTGILPIKKFGTHSGLNMFGEFSMTDPLRLAEFVGFTEPEVRDLCLRFDMDFEEVKFWYDGYSFDSVPHVYNPLSVVSAMRHHDYKNYWNSTETYEALRKYITLNYEI
jgi:hypothetical protein